MSKKPPEPSGDADILATMQKHFDLLEDRFSRLKAETRQAMQMSALGAATATWAHELNNFVTPILNRAKYALQGEDVDEMRKALGTTVHNTEMVISMTDRILGLSGKSLAPNPQAVCVANAVAEAIDALGRDLEKDRIALRGDIPPTAVAWIDPHAFQQILFNLILNARNALVRAGGKLSFTAATKSKRLVLEITDTGVGIPAEQLGSVFEPFTSSKTQESGERPRCGGIGLALSRMLVEESGGTIGVTSSPGTGTTFRIELPTRAEPAS